LYVSTEKSCWEEAGGKGSERGRGLASARHVQTIGCLLRDGWMSHPPRAFADASSLVSQQSQRKKEGEVSLAIPTTPFLPSGPPSHREK